MFSTRMAAPFLENVRVSQIWGRGKTYPIRQSTRCTTALSDASTDVEASSLIGLPMPSSQSKESVMSRAFFNNGFHYIRGLMCWSGPMAVDWLHCLSCDWIAALLQSEKTVWHRGVQSKPKTSIVSGIFGFALNQGMFAFIHALIRFCMSGV